MGWISNLLNSKKTILKYKRPEVNQPSYQPPLRPAPVQPKLDPRIIKQFEQNRVNIGRIMGTFGGDSRKAVALAMAESGFNPKASNFNKWNGSYDDGLFQANSKAQGKNKMYGSRLTQQDPYKSIAFARDLSKREGWDRWSAHKSGAYEKYLPYVDYMGDPNPLD